MEKPDSRPAEERPTEPVPDLDNPEFRTLWDLISYTRQSVFLTGKAGTGKSTFLRYICSKTKKKYVVLSPTGIAAVNAGGVTIHSFFRLPLKPLLSDDPDFATPRRLRDRMKYNASFIKLLKELELIIIDEISMVRADVIDFIDKLLRTYCNNHREPFAGKQLLLVGDVFQLEPVVTSDARELLRREYRNFFFFNARAFEQSAIVPVELKKVYRQNDPEFIAMLDRIRSGAPSRADIDTLNTRVRPAGDEQPGSDFSMTLATRRDIVDYINDRRLSMLRTKEFTYTGCITGDFPTSSLPTPVQLVLKPDAQVVFIKNDVDKNRRWVNGTIGKVIECADDGVVVELENGSRHTVLQEVWNNVQYRYDEETGKINEIVLGSFTQLPLRLAWALTIHKSQGLTFNRAIIDMGQGAFTPGQTYVALSRCRSLEGLTMRSTVNERDMTVNPAVLAFSRNYNSPILVKMALETAHADDCYARAAEAADKGRFDLAFDLFTEGLRSRSELANAPAMRLARQKLAAYSSLADENERLRRELKSKNRTLMKLATEYVSMGEVCCEAADSDAALANFDKAISLAPEYAEAWLAKGILLAGMQSVDEAADCLNRAAALAPDNHRAPLELGMLYLATGDYHNALDRLMVAEQKNGKSAAVNSALADVYEAIGDDEEAEAHRRKAERLRKRRKK